ncbi:MAG: hypothetical protein AAF700_06640 [Pseudomonadota bacterium]
MIDEFEASLGDEDVSKGKEKASEKSKEDQSPNLFLAAARRLSDRTKHIAKSIFRPVSGAFSYISDILSWPGFLMCLALAYLVFDFRTSGYEFKISDETSAISRDMIWLMAVTFCSVSFLTYLFLRSASYRTSDEETKEKISGSIKSIGLTLTAVGVAIALVLQTKADRAMTLLENRTKLSAKVSTFSEGQFIYFLAQDRLRRNCRTINELDLTLSQLTQIKEEYGSDLSDIGLDIAQKDLEDASQIISDSLGVCDGFFSDSNAKPSCQNLISAPKIDLVDDCRRQSDRQSQHKVLTDAVDVFLDSVGPYIASENGFDELAASIESDDSRSDRNSLPVWPDIIWSNYIAPSVALGGIGLEFSFLMALVARRRSGDPSSNEAS